MHVHTCVYVHVYVRTWVYGCCVLCVLVWGMGVVWCVCGCGLWVLCGMCDGVGYGCCVVCVWVWGMGVVWYV